LPMVAFGAKRRCAVVVASTATARFSIRRFQQNLGEPLGRIDHHVVAAGRFVRTPRRIRLRGCKRAIKSRIGVASGTNVDLSRDAIMGACYEDLASEAADWLRHAQAVYPSPIGFVDPECLGRWWRHAEIAALQGCPDAFLHGSAGEVLRRFAVTRYEGVEEND